MCGEKLSEQFVCDVLRDVFGRCSPRFAFLASDNSEHGSHYTLYVEGTAVPQWAQAIDDGLRTNPHYAYCRDLGQLLPLRLFGIDWQAYETFAQHESSKG